MTTVNSRISAVTVFPDRARITRSAATHVEPGSQALEISDLPLHIDVESIRASIRGNARLRLLGVQMRRAIYTESSHERVRHLEEELETLGDRLKGLETRTGRIEHYTGVLGSLSEQTKTFARALVRGQGDLQQQLQMLDGLRARSEALDAEALQIDGEGRGLKRQMEKTKKELAQLRSLAPRERYSALVEIEVEQGGDVHLDLTYVLAGASWTSIYDMRLVEGEQPLVEVGYLAMVSQHTGEEWENVSLTLSTARPALAGTIPELRPWFVRALPPPVPRMQSAPSPKGAAPALPPASLPGEFEEQGMDFLDAEEPSAEVHASGAAVTYTIPGTVTIPPDGAGHRVTVARFSLPPRMDYVIAPGVVEAAYRRARIINDSPYLLLEGSASLFAGDEFVGTTRLDRTAPQAELEIFLGVDDRLRVEREMKRREADRRLLGGRSVLRYGYEITVENLLPHAADVVVHDQIPVSRQDDIQVKLESSEPGPTEHSELNLLRWEMNLKPSERRLVRFDFHVESPRGMPIQGLV